MPIDGKPLKLSGFFQNLAKLILRRPVSKSINTKLLVCPRMTSKTSKLGSVTIFPEIKFLGELKTCPFNIVVISAILEADISKCSANVCLCKEVTKPVGLAPLPRSHREPLVCGTLLSPQEGP